jgi:hypothetical protein
MAGSGKSLEPRMKGGELTNTKRGFEPKRGTKMVGDNTLLYDVMSETLEGIQECC